jgi:hypothetical protein
VPVADPAGTKGDGGDSAPGEHIGEPVEAQPEQKLACCEQGDRPERGRSDGDHCRAVLPLLARVCHRVRDVGCEARAEPQQEPGASDRRRLHVGRPSRVGAGSDPGVVTTAGPGACGQCASQQAQMLSVRRPHRLHGTERYRSSPIGLLRCFTQVEQLLFIAGSLVR